MAAVDNQAAYNRGLDYLVKMQSALPNPAMMDVFQNHRDFPLICSWVGNRVHTLNAIFQAHLTSCHQCFPVYNRRPIAIFAVPLAQCLAIDGFCSLSTPTPTLFIDAGRVDPTGWLAIVAHEYAHALSNSPGHHPQFAAILSHLCLNLGFSPPSSGSHPLHRFPPYHSPVDPLALWRGECSIN
jgi:hypothetical protein